MALPLVPVLLIGGGALLAFASRRPTSPVSSIKTADQLAAGKLALQKARFPGLEIAAQLRGGLRSRGPALGSTGGWAYQAVERVSDGEDAILFAAPSGTPNFIVRGGFYTFYDKFAAALGRPITDEYKRQTDYYGRDIMSFGANKKPTITTQDFENGRMDWVKFSGAVHVYDKKKRIGGWKPRKRKNSYPWWDARAPWQKGLKKLYADGVSFTAIGAGLTICVGGSILTGGAGAVPLCKLGASVAEMTCTVNRGAQELGETLTADFPPSSQIDYPDEGYATNQKDVCDTITKVNAAASFLGGVVITEEPWRRY